MAHKIKEFGSQLVARAWAESRGLVHSSRVPPGPGEYGVTYCPYTGAGIANDRPFVLTYFLKEK